jgi:peptidyl-dipeptidase Dcp
MTAVTLDDITIRTELKPGDIGTLIYWHGALYSDEFHYGVQFEHYVAKGMVEFLDQYDPNTNRMWICEHNGRMVGFLLLMHRGEAAQLRYFYILREYRGIGLGKVLMDLFMEFLRAHNYKSCYLWTTHELYTAAALYKRHGFVLTNEKPSTDFGKALTEQKYELRLS